MGMGDKKEPFHPKYHPIMDEVIGKEFAPCCMRACPHPAVIRRFGIGGVANVSVYTCRKCKHHVVSQFRVGESCSYGKSEEDGRVG